MVIKPVNAKSESPRKGFFYSRENLDALVFCLFSIQIHFLFILQVKLLASLANILILPRI